MMGHKYVKSACLNCRRRKVKCDGNDACSNCINSKLDCSYNADGDMRRQSAKKAIVNLEARIAQLEGVLREHNIDRPQSNPDTPNRSAPFSKAQSTVSETQSLTDTDRNQDDEEESDQEPSPSQPETQPNPVPSIQNPEDNFVMIGTPSFQSPQSTNPPPSGIHESEDGDNSITDILSARMGALRLVEDGQLRYYGPTSNLHMYADGLQSLSSPSFRSVTTEGIEVLRRLGLEQEVPLALEAHLAGLYFAWEDPAIHVVDEDIFFAEKKRCLLQETTSPYYSETLNNAICAIGASLASGEQLNVPEPAAEFFSSRAKALLDVEMDSPTVATVQALVIMSATEAAFTRDARGWLYSGMATRLSADLGLHLDISSHINNGLLTERDMKIRQTAFWGVFIHEHMWNLYAGRPWGLGVQNITIPMPEPETNDSDCRIWKSYPSSVWQPQEPKNNIPFPTNACTSANIALCDYMRQINTTLYAGQMIDLSALVQFLIRIKQEMISWHKTLISSLEVDRTSSGKIYHPAILQLHMQYYATLIFLYRPYLSCQLVSQIPTLDTQESQTAMQNVASDCVEAAHQVTELLRCYQQQHSFRRANVQIVHIILTASLIFIHDVCTRSYRESRHSLNDLQLCCYSLGEIGRCFGNATRALEVVILVKSEWQRIAMSRRGLGAGTKRPSFSISNNPAEPDEENEGNRPRQRHRFSSTASDVFKTPSVATYSQSTTSSYPVMPQQRPLDLDGMNLDEFNLDNQYQDMWSFSGGHEFDLHETVPPIDWFNSQLLEGSHIPTANFLGQMASNLQDPQNESVIGHSSGL